MSDWLTSVFSLYPVFFQMIDWLTDWWLIGWLIDWPLCAAPVCEHQEPVREACKKLKVDYEELTPVVLCFQHENVQEAFIVYFLFNVCLIDWLTDWWLIYWII